MLRGRVPDLGLVRHRGNRRVAQPRPDRVPGQGQEPPGTPPDRRIRPFRKGASCRGAGRSGRADGRTAGRAPSAWQSCPNCRRWPLSLDPLRPSSANCSPLAGHLPGNDAGEEHGRRSLFHRRTGGPICRTGAPPPAWQCPRQITGALAFDRHSITAP